MRTKGFAIALIAACSAAVPYLIFYDSLSATRTQNYVAQPKDEIVQSPANSAVLLYSTTEHAHLLSVHLKDERLAPLTRWAQSYIHKSQFVEDCSKARIFIYDGFSSGFGSEIHVTGMLLAYAIQNNFTMILSPSTCKHFTNCGKGCDCLFRRISNCEYTDVIRSNPDVTRLNGIPKNLSYSIPEVFRHALLSLTPSMRSEELNYWWRGQSAAFLMRFNENTTRAVARLRHNRSMHYFTGGSALPFPLPPGTIAAHMRGGDKFKEMKIVDPPKFVQAATDLIKLMPFSFPSRVLFVSADSEAAIQESRALAEKQLMPFAYTHLNRLAGGHHLGDWNRQSDIQANFYGHLLQLLMSLEADAWIGTRESNWNRLIDELRCVWVDKCPNSYVEVGAQALGSYNC